MKKDIKIENINKSYDGVQVLKNINLTIQDGEFFSILGPSGCGKTTLLRMIAGFIEPASGAIYLGDENLTSLPPNKRNVNTIFQKYALFPHLTVYRMIAGFIEPASGAIYLGDENLTSLPPNKRNVNTIFQKYALFPHLTVYENVAFPLRIRKVDEATIDTEVKKFVKMVGLSEHINKMPNQLSGGQQQRVSIARALINKPGVLLLDEPLSALDAKLRQNLLIELDNIHEEVGITFIFITHDQQEALSISDRIAIMNEGNNIHEEVGITFIFITHDQQEALSISDRIAIMNEGKVLQVGTPAEVYEAPADAFVADFIGENNFFEGEVIEVKDKEYAVLKNDKLGELIFETDKPVKVGDFVQVSIRMMKELFGGMKMPTYLGMLMIAL